MILDLANGLQLLFTGLFAGGAMMEMMVEHPARLAAGKDTARDQMQGVLKRADPLMPGLATLGLLSGVTAYWLGGGVLALAGAVLAGANILFTLVAILPINKTLMAFTAAASRAELEAPMRRWQALHRVRSLAALAAFFLVAAGRLFPPA